MGESTEERQRLGKKLGLCISERRKFLNWTQNQLAERIDVDTETISRFERGATVPSLITLDRIATVLKVGIADLLTDASANPTDQAIRIARLLESLPTEDSNYVFEQIMGLCMHLRKKYLKV
jgi:transcriptional regulator with XRE-family HTH domain